MNVTRLAAGAAVVAGIGISELMSGVGLINAAPLAPTTPSPMSQPGPGGPEPGIPAEKCWKYGRSGGGNPRGGGGVPGFLPPCAASAPIEHG